MLWSVPRPGAGVHKARLSGVDLDDERKSMRPRRNVSGASENMLSLGCPLPTAIAKVVKG